MLKHHRRHLRPCNALYLNARHREQTGVAEKAGDVAGTRWELSGFGDEIDADPSVQLDLLQALDIRLLDLRGMLGRNVLDLTDAEVRTLRADLDARGMAVNVVASPVGKTPVDSDLAAEQQRLARAIEIAHLLGTPDIRVFSWYLPDPSTPEVWREAVLQRMHAVVQQAEAAGCVLLHENEAGIYGASPESCADLHQSVASPALRALWDPGNFASGGYPSLGDAFAGLQPFIAGVHVKDRNAEGRIVVAGAGEVDWASALVALRDADYRGTISLEPHLAVAGKAGGFSGPDGFRDAANALRSVAAQVGIAL